MKDRLVELIVEKENEIYATKMYPSDMDRIGSVADHLIENGVIIPKFKVGDRVWYITGIHRTIVKSAIVEEIIINCNGVSDLFVTSDTGSFENSVDIFYPTKEEAEQKLKEMRVENG